LAKEIMKRQPTITTALTPKSRDVRITFDPESHTYHIDGQPARVSVTGLVKSLFPAFNGREVAEKYFESWRINRSSRYNALIEYLSLGGHSDESIKNEIVQLWSRSGHKRASYGTAVHLQIEQYMTTNTPPEDPSPEFEAFLEWKSSHEMVPVMVEKAVFDEDVMMAGTLDSLWKTPNGDNIIVDWKCSRSIDQSNNFGETGLGIASDLPNSNFHRYGLQQAIYKFILESKYGVPVAECRLLQLVDSHYHEITLPDYSDRVKLLWEQLTDLSFQL
jgi:hypothetical protein